LSGVVKLEKATRFTRTAFKINSTERSTWIRCLFVKTPYNPTPKRTAEIIKKYISFNSKPF
jgi:hypothetical protein